MEIKKDVTQRCTQCRFVLRDGCGPLGIKSRGPWEYYCLMWFGGAWVPAMVKGEPFGCKGFEQWRGEEDADDD